MTSATVERRTITSPVEARATDTDARTIGGHAAVIGERTTIAGLWHEVIAPGAFDGRLNDDVVACFNHSDDAILGRTTSGTCRLTLDNRGLAFDVDLPDTSIGRDVWTLIQRRDLSQCSFAFEIESDEWTRPESPNDLPLRTITKLRRLWDVSVVTHPAYAGTDVSARAMAHAATLVAPEPVTPSLDLSHLAAVEAARFAFLSRS